MATSISFDGNSLQTSNIITSVIAHEGLPQKDAPIYALAHANKSTIPIVNYPRREFTLEGQVIGDDIEDLDGQLDTFRKYFLAKDANLDIGYDGGTRRYIATLSSMNIERPGGLAFANFQARIVCTQPFGQNTSTTTALNANNRTTATYTSANHAYQGTAPYQLPVITLTLDSVTDGDAFMSIVNESTGQGITIVGQTFSGGDVIVIDCKERTVTLNGDEIDFEGSFLQFEPGSYKLKYDDGFTARQIDINSVYYPLFL